MAIIRTVHDFQSLTQFSITQKSSQAQTLQPYTNETREKQKLFRVNQPSNFH